MYQKLDGFLETAHYLWLKPMSLVPCLAFLIELLQIVFIEGYDHKFL